MRKSTLFISAVLTTFVLAMLAGVASAYQNLVVNDQAAKEQTTAQEQPELQADVQPDVQVVAQAAAPLAEESVNLSPQDAVALAGQIMGKDDLYSVEVTELNGETVYLVTFSSGDLVYISMDGQIRSIDKVEVQTVVVNVASTGGGGGGGGESVDPSNNASSNNSGERENHGDDDHREDEDHEDEHEDEHEGYDD